MSTILKTRALRANIEDPVHLMLMIAIADTAREVGYFDADMEKLGKVSGLSPDQVITAWDALRAHDDIMWCGGTRRNGIQVWVINRPDIVDLFPFGEKRS